MYHAACTAVFMPIIFVIPVYKKTHSGVVTRIMWVVPTLCTQFYLLKPVVPHNS
jgi:hypothetical protein